VVLSTLWVFAVLNYLYADLMSLFFQPALQPEAWRELQAGFVGSIEISCTLFIVWYAWTWSRPESRVVVAVGDPLRRDDESVPSR
jgi:hypothetical protein